MRTLSSCQNAYVRQMRTVLEKPRDYPEACFVEGLRASEIFAASRIYELEQWFLTWKVYECLPSFVDKEYVTVISDEVMGTLTRATTPSGLIGFFKEKKHIESKDAFYDYPTFVLHSISDPGNVGAIIRTAAALGRKKIIMIGGCYHHSYKVVQASAGMLAHVRILRTQWNTFLSERTATIPLCALAAAGEPFDGIAKNELESSYLLIGNEAHGLGQDVLSQTDRTVAIPMNSVCESLNAAVAAALVGYRAWG